MAESDDDAFKDILDLCAGWSRPMTGVERVLAIKDIAERALLHPGKVLNRKATEAFDFMQKSKDKSLSKADSQAWEDKGRAVWQ